MRKCVRIAGGSFTTRPHYAPTAISANRRPPQLDCSAIPSRLWNGWFQRACQGEHPQGESERIAEPSVGSVSKSDRGRRVHLAVNVKAPI